MKSNMNVRVPVVMTQIVLIIVLLVAAPLFRAQTPAFFRGTITVISGNTLTVKIDANGERQVEVPSTAAIKRIAPGQKDLSTAAAIPFSDLAIGDRVLVTPDPKATGPTAQALRVIAMKQSDLALKQQKDREDWQRRGVGGLVKSVDSAGGVVVLTSGSGATAKTITVHTTKATLLKRYAPASVQFDEAKPAPIEAIHAGDQLRARGTKNADGTELTAEEAVSGTFRNISGTIASMDSAASTLTVKDLTTKKQVTIHITAEAQMRRLPEIMARMLAARLTRTSPAGGQTQNVSGAAQRGWSGQGGSQGNGRGQYGGQGGGDPEQMLSRLPPIQLADLKKGDAIMLVSTDGATEVTAITLLAGVEALLEAPAASQNLLNNWSMNSGSGAAEAAAQ
jgi:hypothetical protein